MKEARSKIHNAPVRLGAVQSSTGLALGGGGKAVPLGRQTRQKRNAGLGCLGAAFPRFRLTGLCSGVALYVSRPALESRVFCTRYILEMSGITGARNIRAEKMGSSDLAYTDAGRACDAQASTPRSPKGHSRDPSGPCTAAPDRRDQPPEARETRRHSGAHNYMTPEIFHCVSDFCRRQPGAGP